MFPWRRSPWAGGKTLWSRRGAGEPPESASVTAEAGKLPTLRVRPFWPFQVVESGLWEEGIEGGWAWPTFNSQAVCTELHLPGGKEASPHPRNTKGLYGLGGLQWERSLRGPAGKMGGRGSGLKELGNSALGAGSGRLTGSPHPADTREA